MCIPLSFYHTLYEKLLNRDTNQVTLHLRRYVDSLRKWLVDNETFYNAPDGICTIDLTRISPFIRLTSKLVVPSTIQVPVLPLQSYFAHSKILEEYWAGRRSELSQLTEWYQDETVKVIGLVGFGGVGKTALARHWIEEVCPDGIFWWCFYHEPSLDAFLLTALKYLSCGQFRPEEVVSSQARVRTLLDYLASGRFILVLDGLEEMQAVEDKGEHFGEMNEFTFRDLLQGCAGGNHHSLALITTRYPLKDLQPYEGQGYRRLFLGHLSIEDSRKLIRKRGVKGADRTIDITAHDYNYHALSLKLIAGYLKEYYNGDIAYFSEIPFSALETDKKVNNILAAYGDKLDEAQRTFLSIFSIFRRPVGKDALDTVFRHKIPDFDNRAIGELKDFDFFQKVKHLVNMGLINEDKHGQKVTYSTHPLIHRYYSEHLKEKARLSIHKQVAKYYEERANPQPKTIEDLTYAIEAFHHNIQTTNYEKADDIYSQKINPIVSPNNYLLTSELGAYELDFNLISQFFPQLDINQKPLINRKAWPISHVGFCLTYVGRVTEAVQFYRRFIQMVSANKDWNNASIGSQNLCWIQLKLGRLTDGEAAARQSLVYNHRVEERGIREINKRNSLGFWAYAAFLQGKNKKAKKLFNQIIKLERKRYPESPWLPSIFSNWYAEFLVRSGAQKLAEEITHQNIVRSNQISDKTNCYWLLSGFYLERQDYYQAADYLNNALQIARNSGLQEEIAKLYLGFAKLFFARKELHAAESALKQETLSICARCGYKIIEIDARNVLSVIYRAANQPTLAYSEAHSALDMSRACGYYWGQFDAQRILELIDKKG